MDEKVDRKVASRDYISDVVRRASETRADNMSKRFVSREALVCDLDAHTVARLLRMCFPGGGEDVQDFHVDPEAVAAYVSPGGGCPCRRPRCTGARIIFVTLSLIAREDHIGVFARDRVCDSSLPFSICEEQLVVSKGKRGAAPREIQEWTEAEKQLFCHFQWAMLSPYFKKTALQNISTEMVDAEACLPWAEYGKALGESDQCDDMRPSFIRKVRISSHYNDLGYKYLALKGQRSRVLGWETFQNEVAGNVRTAIPHENIVTLLAAFTHAGSSYLLFPWAEGGNLVDLWKELKPGGLDDADSLLTPLPSWCSPDWVWNQCQGLADGLSFIHGFQVPSSSGSPKVVPQLHADIQPRNILCFETKDQLGGSSYILKISDFEFSAPFERPGFTETIDVCHTAPRYNPPEIRKDERKNNKHVAQNWDVWCLGCVYLEFLSWYRYGYMKGVNHFAEVRMGERHDPEALKVLGSKREEQTFFRIILDKSPSKKYLFHFRRAEGIGFEIRKSVIKRYRLLEADFDEARMKRVIKFIERTMLVIDKGKRATSKDVHQFFLTNNH